MNIAKRRLFISLVASFLVESVLAQNTTVESVGENNSPMHMTVNEHAHSFSVNKKNQENDVDPDKIQSILTIETALVDGNYAYAAQEALNFTKSYEVVPWIAEIATSYYYSEGKYEQAYEAVRYWYKEDPDNEEVANLYMLLLGETGKEDELVQVLQQNLKTAAKDKIEDKLSDNAAILSELKDKNKALKLFEDSIKPFAFSSTNYHLLYADFAIEADKDDLAWQETFKAIDTNPTSEDAAIRVLSLAQGPKRAQGMAFVKEFLKKNPDNRILSLSYINELSKDNAYDEAIAEISKLQKRNPKDSELLYFQALIHYDAQDWTHARKVLSQFIDLTVKKLAAEKVKKQINKKVTEKVNDDTNIDTAISGEESDSIKANNGDSANVTSPSSLEDSLLDARKLMVSILKAEKKYRLALNQIDLIKADKLDANMLMEKAQLLANLSDVRQALSVLENATIAFPESRGNILWFGGNLLNESGRTDQAVVYYNDALKELPESADIKYALAMLYEKRGEVWPAEKLLREVIKSEPNMADGYNALGYIYADRNYNLEEAEQLLTEALRIDASNPYILDSMGWLQYRLKNYDSAMQYLERAYDIEQQPIIAAHLADVYNTLGEQKRAKDILDYGLSNYPSDPILLETSKRLNLDKK
ncbi:tetratricopeptide repeat protein [Pelistega sp. MC2]|uniref:tetratricopeptide repeat protein n=1 Tax=Pelistega sp. MC2 TaxID=1720297 RepID=UPI0008D9030E|nr:tetratricopeptide repeat protein [Pelistega sp. MC2]